MAIKTGGEPKSERGKYLSGIRRNKEGNRMKKRKLVLSLVLAAALLVITAAAGVTQVRAEGEDPLDSFEIVDGASIRIIDREEAIAAKENGLRFSIAMKQTDYNAFVAEHANDASLRFGLLIAPDEEKFDLTVEKVFGPKKQYDWATWNTSTKKWDDPKTSMTQIVNFETVGLRLADSSLGEDPDKVYYRASILNFTPDDITRNFQAVGYVCYTENGQKTYKLTGKVSRSMVVVAQKAIADGQALSASDYEWLRKAYLGALMDGEANYTVEYYIESADGYGAEPFLSEVKTAPIDSEVTIDELDLPGFVCDEARENILSGKVLFDGSLVLKRYYKDSDQNEGNALVDYYPGWGGSEATATISQNTDPEGLCGENSVRSVKIEDKDITGWNDYVVKFNTDMYNAFSADVKVVLHSDSDVADGLPLTNDTGERIGLIKLGEWQKIYSSGGFWGLIFQFPRLIDGEEAPTGSATIYLDNITFYTKEQVDDGSWAPKEGEAYYAVEYYKDTIGYAEPFKSEMRSAPIGTEVTIDEIEMPGFVIDAGQNNVVSGKVKFDSSLVLKRYYKTPAQYIVYPTVDFTWGGSAETAEITENTDPEGLCGRETGTSVKIEDKDIADYNDYAVRIPSGYDAFSADVKVKVMDGDSEVTGSVPLTNDNGDYLGVIKLGEWQKIYSSGGFWVVTFQFPDLIAGEDDPAGGVAAISLDSPDLTDGEEDPDGEDPAGEKKPAGTAIIYLDNITFYTKSQVESGSWAPTEGDANYAIEYYSDADGYAKPFQREVRTAPIGTEVAIEELTEPGFVYDEGRDNIVSGKVLFDNTLVLKRYYKDFDKNERSDLVGYYEPWSGSEANSGPISQNTDPVGLCGENSALSVKIEDKDITGYNEYVVKIPDGYCAYSADVKVVLNNASAVPGGLTVTNDAEDGHKRIGLIKLDQWQKIYSGDGNWGLFFQFPSLTAVDGNQPITATIYLDNITFYTKEQVEDGSWIPEGTQANYTVEYYSDADGYAKPFKSEVRTAAVGDEVTIEDLNQRGFVYDAAQANVTSGKVTVDGALVLRRYYKDFDKNERSGIVGYYTAWGGSVENSGPISQNTDSVGLYGDNSAISVKIEDVNIAGWNDYTVQFNTDLYNAFSADVMVVLESELAVSGDLPLTNASSKRIGTIKLNTWQKIYASGGDWVVTFAFPDLFPVNAVPNISATIYLDNITFYTKEQVDNGSWLPDEAQAKYTVEYYKETATGYGEPFKHEERTAPVGSGVTIEDIEVPGFVLDTAQSVLSGVVQSDGTLVLTRYYKDPDHNEENVLVDYAWGGNVNDTGPISSNTDKDGLCGENSVLSVKIENKNVTGWNDFTVKIPDGYGAFSADVKVTLDSDPAATGGLPLTNVTGKRISLIELGQWKKIYSTSSDQLFTFAFPKLIAEGGAPTGSATIYLDNITFYTNDQVKDGSWLPEDVRVEYTVEYYVESADGYGEEAYQSEKRFAPVGAEVVIEELQLPGFVLDTAQDNVLSGFAQSDVSLVLRRYYKDPDHNEETPLIRYYTDCSAEDSGTISNNTNPDGLFDGNGAFSVMIEVDDITKVNKYMVWLSEYQRYSADVKVVLYNASNVPNDLPLENDVGGYLGTIKFGEWQKIYSVDSNWGLFFQFPSLTPAEEGTPVSATIYLDNITLYTKDQVEDGSWAPTTGDANYVVEYYIESAAGYGEKPSQSEVRTAQIGTEVAIDELELLGFVYDEANENVLTGNVKFDNTLVLKRYYKDPDHEGLVTYHIRSNGSTATATISVNTDKEGLFMGSGVRSVKIEDFDITKDNEYMFNMNGYDAFSADVKVDLNFDSAFTKDLPLTNDVGKYLGVVKLGEWKRIYSSDTSWAIYFKFDELVAEAGTPTGTATIYLDNITFYTADQVSNGSFDPNLWVANSTGVGDGDAIEDMKQKFEITLGTSGSLYKNYYNRYVIQTVAASANGSHTVKVIGPRFTDVSGYEGISFAIDLQIRGNWTGATLPLYLVKNGASYTTDQLNGMTNLSDSTDFIPIHNYTVDKVDAVNLNWIFNGSEIVRITKEQLETVGYDPANLNELTIAFCDVKGPTDGLWLNVFNMYFYDFRVY